MPPAPLVQLTGAAITFGGRPLFSGIDLALAAGDRACLVGRNGSGKSTLLRVLSGEIELDAGARFVQPGTRIAYLPQEPRFAASASVAAYVRGGLGSEAGPDADARIADMLARLQLAGDTAPAQLSGGEARRADLARALVSRPELLLLDEPTNGLDPAGREAMLGLIHRIGTEFGIAVVVCSHLLGEVERICDTLVAIDSGRLLRADRIDAMTRQQGVLAIEVDEGTEELAAGLATAGLRVAREGRLLLVPLAPSGETYDQIMRVVADLELPLHRLEERRHHVAELFAGPNDRNDPGGPTDSSAAPEANHAAV